MATIRERKGTDGKLAYTARVRMKGAAEQSATFSRLTDAKKWIQDIESAIRDGRNFRGTESKRHTVAETIDRYTRDVLPKKSAGSQHAQEFQLHWWKERIGACSLAEVTPALITECRDELSVSTTKRGTTYSPATVNRHLAAISHLFTVATKQWFWTASNPVLAVSKLREARGRIRFLDDSERQRLLDACAESRNPHLLDIVTLALSTGMRRGEILSLKWKDIDLRRGVISIMESKNGERRGVPLVGPAHAQLTERSRIRRIDSQLVFPSPDGSRATNLQTAWKAAMTRAGLENFRFHDLRHSCASYLAMRGASLSEIGQILGHKTVQMSARYSHLSADHSTKVLAAMVGSIFGSSKAETIETANAN